jgi:2-keto-3-deoxy-L-rhamnonate aldolase RhmA
MLDLCEFGADERFALAVFSKQKRRRTAKGEKEVAVKELRAGGRAVGTMVRLVRNPGIAWIARQAGLDFIMVDLEHGSSSPETLADVASAGRGAGVEVFVRVPELAKGYVSRALDSGCTGVMVPMVESLEQAELLAGWSKFAPVGRRGLGSIGNHTNFAAVRGDEAPGFMAAANDRVLANAQIETAAAIEGIESIAAVPGIDALLIGPNDLAVSLGYPGDLQNPRVLEAIDRVTEAAGRHGKIFGMHGPDALMERYLPKGLHLIMSNLDINLLLAAMREIAARWKAG